MSIFQIFLVFMSFSLGIISILSLISPKTPYGRYIYKYLIFNNEKVSLFFIRYRELSRYIWGVLFTFIVYLVLSITDFYKLYAGLFVVSYYILLTLLLSSLLDIESMKGHIGKFFGYFIAPVIILFISVYIFSYSDTTNMLFQNGKTYISEEILKDEELLNLDTSKTLEGYIKNYENYALYSSFMNRILFLHAETEEKPLFKKLNTSKTTLSFLANELQEHIHQSFPPIYQKILIKRSQTELIEYRKTLKYQHRLFPVKIMPAYLASLTINKISKPFSRVAVTTKIIGVTVFEIINENYTIVVSLFILTNALFLFYILAVFFKMYNQKYDKKWGGDYFYSSMVVALLSFAVGINAIII